MENTGKVLFEDTSAQWFVALGKAWIGPLTAADVYAKIVRQEISLAHFIWRKVQKDWQRIYDTEPFKSVIPAPPSPALRAEVATKSREFKTAKKSPPPPPPKSSSGIAERDKKTWYLYVNETQLGPFSTYEIEQHLHSGQINEQAYAWRDGMEGWERIVSINALKNVMTEALSSNQNTSGPSPVVVPASPRKKASKSDLRDTTRRPMVAKIILSNSSEVGVGVCRDISIGGMQVLTENVPRQIGGVVKINVSPLPEKYNEKNSGKKASFKAFVAEGTVVRILEDGRGFSFRFTKLSDSARRSIEAYLTS